MDTAVKPVQTGRGRRRRWSAEQKLVVLQEWQTGIPLEEICRKYAMNAAQMYRWKRSLDQGLKEPGKLVRKSHVLGLQKRVEERERALGLTRAIGPDGARSRMAWRKGSSGGLQVGLRLSGMPRDVCGGESLGAAGDQARQSAGPAQHLRDTVACRVLCGMDR